MVVARININAKAMTSNVYYSLPDYLPPIDYIYTGTSAAPNANKGAYYVFGTTYQAHPTALDVRAYYRGTKLFQLRRSIASHTLGTLVLNYRAVNEGQNQIPL